MSPRTTIIMALALSPAILLLSLTGCNGNGQSQPATTPMIALVPAATLPSTTEMEIMPKQVKALRDAGVDFLLIDCREPDETVRSRIAGSVLVPITNVEAYVPLLQLDKNRPMVVYCTAGMRSYSMTDTLRAKGFTAVWSMSGGIRRWIADVEPNLKRP